MKQYDEFFRHTWDFKRGPETLRAGNYEWPFSLVISGATQESLEGMLDTWVVYRMKATMERGMLHQNTIARKQIRLIRTLNPSDLEMSHAMSVDNTWVNKVEYSLSIPSKAVIFGSTIQVDYKFIPQLKGLRIGKIITELRQKHVLRLKTSRNLSKSHNHSHSVCSDTYDFPPDQEAMDIDGQEGFNFSRQLVVPQSLRQCAQDFDGFGIKIRHHLAFYVQLLNPDGHISELHASLPVHIFISPNLPIDDSNNLVNGVCRQMSVASAALTDLTPPQYGDHILDQLYSDIDPSGYATPGGPSGISTPVSARSRSASYDNLGPLTMTPNGEDARALHARLVTVNTMARSNSLSHTLRQTRQPSVCGEGIAERDFSHHGTSPLDTSANGEYFAERISSSSDQTPTETISQNSSGEEAGRISPEHIEHRVEDLSKVPSYSTALHTNSRTPIHDGLPSYQNATRSMCWALGQASIRN